MSIKDRGVRNNYIENISIEMLNRAKDDDYLFIQTSSNYPNMFGNNFFTYCSLLIFNNKQTAIDLANLNNMYIDTIDGENLNDIINTVHNVTSYGCAIIIKKKTYLEIQKKLIDIMNFNLYQNINVKDLKNIEEDFLQELIKNNLCDKNLIHKSNFSKNFVKIINIFNLYNLENKIPNIKIKNIDSYYGYSYRRELIDDSYHYKILTDILKEEKKAVKEVFDILSFFSMNEDELTFLFWQKKMLEKMFNDNETERVLSKNFVKIFKNKKSLFEDDIFDNFEKIKTINSFKEIIKKIFIDYLTNKKIVHMKEKVFFAKMESKFKELKGVFENLITEDLNINVEDDEYITKKINVNKYINFDNIDKSFTNKELVVKSFLEKFFNCEVDIVNNEKYNIEDGFLTIKICFLSNYNKKIFEEVIDLIFKDKCKLLSDIKKIDDVKDFARELQMYLSIKNTEKEGNNRRNKI